MVRAIRRLAPVAFSLGFTSAAFAQQTDASVNVAQQTPASSVGLAFVDRELAVEAFLITSPDAHHFHACR